MCKYLNKGIATTYDGGGDDMSPARAAHIDRPADEVRWLPCASSCANWLRFGVQPKNAAPEMVPGHCMHKAHERAFTTWVHRVAVNHLLDRKRSAVERFELTFGAFAEDLHDGLAPIAPNAGPELDLLAREVEHGCTLALLTCLDRESRVAYVLGEVFGVASAEGAWICETTETAYRKRLSRARAAVRVRRRALRARGSRRRPVPLPQAGARSRKAWQSRPGHRRARDGGRCRGRGGRDGSVV